MEAKTQVKTAWSNALSSSIAIGSTLRKSSEILSWSDIIDFNMSAGEVMLQEITCPASCLVVSFINVHM